MKAEDISKKVFVDQFGCHHWLGAFDNGFPAADIDGKRVRIRTYVYGKHSKTHFVYMTCGANSCINPKHMGLMKRWNGIQPNTAQRQKLKDKKRAEGKLSVEKARQVREMWNSGITLAEIGRRFGVSTATAHKTARQELWAEASPWK